MEISSFANNNVFDEEKGIASAFSALVPPSNTEKKRAIADVMEQVTITDDYTPPATKLDPAQSITMTKQETGETFETTAGKLKDALALGMAKILPGSTSERVMLEANGEVYIVVGDAAHMVIDSALEVAGFFGAYQLTSSITNGDLFLLEDDESPVVVSDLDGNQGEE